MVPAWKRVAIAKTKVIINTGTALFLGGLAYRDFGDTSVVAAQAAKPTGYDDFR